MGYTELSADDWNRIEAMLESAFTPAQLSTSVQTHFPAVHRQVPWDHEGFAQVIHQLVDKANRQGVLARLLAAAADKVPERGDLRALADEFARRPAAGPLQMPSDTTRPAISPPVGQPATPRVSPAEWDVFISHAWEDKEAIARPLAKALQAKGLRVWFDEFTLSVGDRLQRSIDKGLACCKYGIVILSPTFFAKEWPQKELDGLMQRENKGEKVILPVWHNIGAEQIRAYSPSLADRIGVRSDVGLERVVGELLRGMRYVVDPQTGRTVEREKDMLYCVQSTGLTTMSLFRRVADDGRHGLPAAR